MNDKDSITKEKGNVHQIPNRFCWKGSDSNPLQRPMVSSRPVLYTLSNPEVVCYRRLHRKIAGTWLNQRAVDSYTNILDYESVVLLKELFKAGNNPINPQPHAGRCSLNNMLTITFGTRTESVDAPLVKQALKLSREFM